MAAPSVRSSDYLRNSATETSTAVIVGGGLAGLSAAAEVLANGGSVVVVDKAERLGGNSAKASSGINGAGSWAQEKAGIHDSADLLTNDTLKSGRGRSSPELASIMAGHSADAIRFLQTLGVNLDSVLQLGGHSRARTHRAGPDGKPTNMGYRIMSSLIAHLQEEEKKDPARAKILLRSTATELLSEPASDDGTRVTGVRVVRTLQDGSTEAEDLPAGAVVLTTGGFAADKAGLLKQYAPCLQHLPTTNGPFATGDGVRLGLGVGAALVDMDQVQVHPTGLVNPSDPTNPVKILGPEALRGSGGILLNHKGFRFVNELATRDHVVDGILKNCTPLSPEDLVTCSEEEKDKSCPVPVVVAHLILSEEAFERFGEVSAKFYLAKGLLRKFHSLTELCQALDLPLSQVQETLKEYDAAATGQASDPFGKTVFPSSFEGYLSDADDSTAPSSTTLALYSALVTPVLHYCMGGLRFDAFGRVLRQSKEGDGKFPTIPGLYAAGEVTGGLHGANRLAGNSLLECVVYGRLAARTALLEMEVQQEVLSHAELKAFSAQLVPAGGKSAAKEVESKGLAGNASGDKSPGSEGLSSVKEEL